MAIFASTTTSGYSDPLKAYSIKALELRQKDMMAQQAAEQAKMFTPENTQTPIQGVAQVANVAADAFRQKRVDDAAAAGRNELSGIIGQGPQGPNGEWSPQQQAIISTRSPDLYKEIATAMDARRAQQALFGQQDKARADQARLDQEAEKAKEQRLQERPTDEPLVTLRRAFDRKEITQEEYDARKKQLTGPKIAEQKFITDQQEKSVAGQSLLGTLDEALALTNHPKGIHAGGAAGFVQGVGEMIPTRFQGAASAVGLDPETTANTQRYNQIMGEQALNLLNQMKGASSDRDVQVNFKIANDANATVENKRKAIQWLQAKVASLLQVHNDSIKEAGGTVPTMPKPDVGGATTSQAGGGGGPGSVVPSKAGGGGPEQPQQPQTQPQATTVPRPAGKNDSELIQEAKDAIAAHPEKRAAIEAQLQKWMMGN